MLINEKSVVTALVTKEEAEAARIDELVEKTFEGSLPAFVAAFTRRKDMTDAEIDEISRMIENYRKENADG